MTFMPILLMFSSMAMTMFLMINPISMGILILMMSLLLAILFSYMMSSWVSFLIFLIYIGGMLVMFSYFVAIIPNQTLFMKPAMISILIFILSAISITQSLKMNPPVLSTYTTQLNVLFMESNTLTMIMLACVLLFTMIMVVKLTMLTKGPLRPFIS